MVEGEAVAVTEIGVEEDTVVVVGVAVAMMVVVAEAVAAVAAVEGDKLAQVIGRVLVAKTTALLVAIHATDVERQSLEAVVVVEMAAVAIEEIAAGVLGEIEIETSTEAVLVAGTEIDMMIDVVEVAVEVGIMTEAAVVETGRGIRKKSSTVR